MKNDKNYLQAINMLMQIVIAFFDVFFSIFVFEMSNDLTFVLSYLVFQSAIILICERIVMNILSEKTYLIIYRLSFVFILISIALNFTISSSTLYMAFVVQFVYAIAIICYYLPHEVSIMNKNNDKSMSTFVGVHHILTLAAGIIGPFVSGFLIDYVDYPVLFGFIIVLAFICFMLSFKINKGVIDTPKIKLTEFSRKAHKIKHVKLAYISHALHKASQASVVLYLLPILLFMKFNTNFSVGQFSALATAISGVVLILITKYAKPKKIYIIIATAVLVIVSMLVMFFSSIEVFIAYYFLTTISDKLIFKYDAEMVYIVTSGTPVSPYKKEHHATFNHYDQYSKIGAYLITLLVYNFSRTILSISIVIFGLTILQIFSSILMIKSDEEYKKYLEENGSESDEDGQGEQIEQVMVGE